jgi:hypothetical protein
MATLTGFESVPAVWVPAMHKASGNWRVVVPARWSGTGKRHHRYFDTKGAAERFIAETLAARHTDVSFRNVKMNNHKV